MSINMAFDIIFSNFFKKIMFKLSKIIFNNYIMCLVVRNERMSGKVQNLIFITKTLRNIKIFEDI